jgi:hypothetical protein
MFHAYKKTEPLEKYSASITWEEKMYLRYKERDKEVNLDMIRDF